MLDLALQPTAVALPDHDEAYRELTQEVPTTPRLARSCRTCAGPADEACAECSAPLCVACEERCDPCDAPLCDPCASHHVHAGA